MPDNIHKLWKGIAFDVELQFGTAAQKIRNFENVERANVTLIGPRMCCDPLGSSTHCGFHSFHYAGNSDIPRIAQQRDLINVDAQFGHLLFATSSSVRRTQTSTI